eukprot:5461779-Amphidinium_carterae.1
MQQGQERSRDSTVASAIQSLRQPGVAVAAGLLTTALCTPHPPENHRGGACHDLEDEEILYAMREWTQAWQRGQFPAACTDERLAVRNSPESPREVATTTCSTSRELMSTRSAMSTAPMMC